MVPKPENKLTAWYVNEPEKVLDVQRIQQIIGEGAEFYEVAARSPWARVASSACRTAQSWSSNSELLRAASQRRRRRRGRSPAAPAAGAASGRSELEASYTLTSSYEDAAAMLERIRQRKKIRYEDRLHLSPHKDDYVSMTEMFRREHKHPDQEVRYFERGTGFLDVRDKSDRWLRLQVGAGHLLVLPAQIYHRFSPATQQEEIVVHRLFEDVDTWTADFRDDQGNQ
ncbi:uncharacterized protein [Dermacentor andersoni]|uniref:uncharacterized protein isoform X1 n=1 Tax=Dermacentor andersoni TaxID=34620 RepID=UPI002417E1ED|nr:acireductone dioxygenase-like isoform X1 [Dermacentor andersoni]